MNYLKGRSFLLRRLFVSLFNQSSKISGSETGNAIQVTEPKPDALYKTLEIEVRGHDRAVLNSYKWFATFAAKELGIQIGKVWEPPVVKVRIPVLKSVFVHGKHKIIYEIRNYFRVIELKHLTGSTADTYLEYIQRNLPEGVAMKATKHAIEKIPKHIQAPVTTGVEVQETSSTDNENRKEAIESS